MNKKLMERPFALGLEVYNHAILDIEAYANKDAPFKQTGKLTHLDLLEAEALQMLQRKIEANNPVMLYSLGRTPQ